jgi:ubiquinone/menaquinone biosynthesis C-methylase UbiE
MSNFKKQYDHLWGNISKDENAHKDAVGGDFEAVGHLEFQLLRSIGLKKESSIIDVGCGSGRLASQLAPWLTGPYLGTDILGSLLDYARDLCRRDDWRFVETNGFDIPAPDNSADFAVFFSVFTHLTHEDSWKYVLESQRVLRGGGKLVITFLEFAIYSHWTVFENTVKDKAPEKILNQFLSRDALASFAEHGGFAIESYLDGDKANIPIEREVVWESGVRMTGMGGLGQSTCVMVKK